MEMTKLEMPEAAPMKMFDMDVPDRAASRLAQKPTGLMIEASTRG
eukprot:CAMPEP_0168491894 /NCGR_PEP_ID=MMETSP0228-20121227/69930_1 /TAXON_ID=133427 /ORGANISM="Protoceratium reticulatum, Strain CCCM 535 (=CCMP 1889)" /LENGTH=44 /DNA_ID= /DNA_START= /DNA_END= /DNA_ORIENTATION=